MAGHQAITDALNGVNVGKIWYDEPMSRHASLKLGGRVDALVMTENEDQLGEVDAKTERKKYSVFAGRESDQYSRA